MNTKNTLTIMFAKRLKGDFMLSEFIPVCPRLHPGMMVPDDSTYEKEWFCRVCGTRLYGNDQGGAELPEISTEEPTREGVGNLTGKPRKSNSRYRYLRDDSAGGKWYE